MPNQTNTAQNQGKGLSWAVVIIVLIVFWPVGIYLLYKKLSGDKQAALNSGNTLFVIGLVLAFMGVIAVIVGPSDQSMAVSGRIEYFIVFVCSGLALLAIGILQKNRAKKCRKYIAVIANQRCTSIDEIAAAVPVSYETAVKDLQKMIDKGYFSNAYIDAAKREIVPVQSQTENGFNVATVQMETVVCKSCGANSTKPAGVPSKCEYCGSPIN